MPARMANERSEHRWRHSQQAYTQGVQLTERLAACHAALELNKQSQRARIATEQEALLQMTDQLHDAQAAEMQAT